MKDIAAITKIIQSEFTYSLAVSWWRHDMFNAATVRIINLALKARDMMETSEFLGIREGIKSRSGNVPGMSWSRDMWYIDRHNSWTQLIGELTRTTKCIYN